MSDKRKSKYEALVEAHQGLSNTLHDEIVGKQAAWIEWRYGDGAEAAMRWIENGLAGPGLIPALDEPYAKEAQAYYDANRSNPFPKCFCGRPSNRLWMGRGFCSAAHYSEAKKNANH